MSRAVRSGPADVLAMLLRLDVAGCDIGVLLASSSEDGESPNLQRLNISRDLAADFRGLVQRKLSAWRVESENGDLLLRHFDPVPKLEGDEIEETWIFLKLSR